MTLDDPPKPRGNPRPVTPDRDGSLHPNRMPGSSLAESLGDVVDDARQLLTDFGLRPYRVFSVVVKWSGGEVGRGHAELVRETEILPTPKMGAEQTGISTLENRMTSGGTSERGTVRMTGVSPRYTEDDIHDLFHVQPLPLGHDGYLEVRVDQRDGRTICRRFTALVPSRRPEKFDWVVPLRRQSENEHRDLKPAKLASSLDVDIARAKDRSSW